MARSRYRHRTSLREKFPERIAALIPKGSRDCGDHEWYSATEQTWRCYHCESGVTDTVPWDQQELTARRQEADAMRIRAGTGRKDRSPVSR